MPYDEKVYGLNIEEEVSVCPCCDKSIDASSHGHVYCCWDCWDKYGHELSPLACAFGSEYRGKVRRQLWSLTHKEAPVETVYKSEDVVQPPTNFDFQAYNGLTPEQNRPTKVTNGVQSDTCNKSKEDFFLYYNGFKCEDLKDNSPTQKDGQKIQN